MKQLIVALWFLCVGLLPVASQSAEEQLPKLYRSISDERWTNDLGKAETPLQAFLTWQACYSRANANFCAEVGITGEAFEPDAAEILFSEDSDIVFPDHWVFSQRTLGNGDITLLGGERAWARSGYVEIAYYPVHCAADDDAEACALAASRLPIVQYGHWAYFKPVGSTWHLAGWSETPYRSSCLHQCPSDLRYPQDCRLAFSPFDEGFRRLLESRGWSKAEPGE